MIKILAERDGQRHEFTPEQWAAFPEHKYGWAEVRRQVPDVVEESIKPGQKKETPAKGPIKS